LSGNKIVNKINHDISPSQNVRGQIHDFLGGFLQQGQSSERKNLSILVQILVLLDQREGELQRKITIPFIKEILNL